MMNVLIMIIGMNMKTDKKILMIMITMNLIIIMMVNIVMVMTTIITIETMMIPMRMRIML